MVHEIYGQRKIKKGTRERLNKEPSKIPYTNFYFPIFE